jgi:uncharacterized repeat protein (TIGR02543 family)
MAGKAAGWSLVVLAALALGVSGAGGHSLATTTVLVQVIGHGTVTGTSGTINCGDGSTECYYTTTAASGSITLTATADTGWSFTGWGGDCSGSGSCTLTFGSDYEATANFAQGGAGTSTLSVDVTGDASGKGGTVKGGNIDCDPSDSDCTWDVTTGSTVTVVETPEAGYTFSGWGGACSGSDKSCTVVMNSDQSVNASFTASATSFTLSVSVAGNGTVTGGGIACTSAGGSGCSASVTTGSSVTLTATPTAGASFLGWGGACAGSAVTCAVTVSANTTVTATFSGAAGGSTFPLTVTVTGSGSVTGGGIACGNGESLCSASLAAGSSVTLTAVPASGATFGSWGGACSGSSTTCTLTMNAAKSVSATFTGGSPSPAAGAKLTLKVAGRGKVSASGGTCSSSGPAKTCTQSYDAGATVRLTAAPASGARFLGWAGACAGASTTCTVKLTGSTTVTATFSGASAGAALARRGRPIVRRVEGGFQVTLRFRAGTRGTARVRALRAGRVETALSFTAAPGPGTIGPFPVRKPGFYVFELRLGRGALQWRACLGRCGAGAPGGPFTVVREPAGVVRAGEAWSVTIHFRSNRPAGAELSILRGRKAVRHLRFAPVAGEISSGPFVVTPGTYTLRLIVTDAYGRTRLLTWFAFLPG